jgi:hypothetical protein
MHNNPLREEPRWQRAAVIRSNHEFFLLEWLRSTGRLIEREAQEPDDYLNEVEEISEIIEVDDLPYSFDDDEIDVDLEE